MSQELSTLEAAHNAHGYAESYSTLTPDGAIDRDPATSAFFKSMGINGRTCASCHEAESGWTIGPEVANRLFDESAGLHNLFLTHDNGTRPDADLSTESARREAFRPLLERGLTRGTRRVPAGAEFELLRVDDPYGWSTVETFSGMRRPGPAANIALKSSLTWTGGPQEDMYAFLKAFMVNGTRGHGQTSYVPSEEEQVQGADFMLSLYFAQAGDNVAGRLDEGGARGGPVHLSQQAFYPGINDPAGASFNPKVFDIYDAWSTIDPSTATTDQERRKLEQRRLIARGQEVFNTRTFEIGGVSGLNDALGRPTLTGTCGTCHNAPNVGTHSVFRLMDLGLVDLRDSDRPRLRVRNVSTGEEREVSDLGRALVTGKWADIGKMSVPMLRGLSQRAPYFHAGQARTVEDVIDFYKGRFDIDFQVDEKEALAAFLKAL